MRNDLRSVCSKGLAKDYATSGADRLRDHYRDEMSIMGQSRQKVSEPSAVQKLEVVCKSTEKVAHEVCNSLVPIEMITQLLLDQDLGESVKLDLETIYREALKASELLQELQSVVSANRPSQTYGDLTEVLDQ